MENDAFANDLLDIPPPTHQMTTSKAKYSTHSRRKSKSESETKFPTESMASLTNYYGEREREKDHKRKSTEAHYNLAKKATLFSSSIFFRRRSVPIG